MNDAYKTYEELLLSAYQMLNMVFQSIYVLAMQDKDREKAYILVEKQSELANIFEMGEYHEVSCRLDLATADRDEEATIETMERMLASVDKIYDFTKSNLYEHMEFNQIDEKFITELHKNLLTNFSDEETYSYMKKNKRWQELVSSNL